MWLWGVCVAAVCVCWWLWGSVRRWLMSRPWLALLWHDCLDETLRDLVTGSSRPRRLLAHVTASVSPGDALGVVNAIDGFCHNVEWAMNLGDEKGLIVDSVLREVSPGLVLELGSYCGYSAVRMGRLLPPGARLLTIEFNPEFASIARQVISLAGLDSKVEVIEGSTWDVIPELRKKHGVETIDFVFLDHWKERYTADTRLLEECGLLREGCVLVADNVITPGAPDYLDYVRSSPRYRSRHYPTHLEYTLAPDGIEVSVYRASS